MSYIVRRTTAVAIVMRVTNTDLLTSSPLCHKSWTSKNELNHRRTIILFNELHSRDDGLPFTEWISPNASGSDLWDLPADPSCPTDDEAMALLFIQRFVARIWHGVVEDLGKVIDECSKHIIHSVCRSRARQDS